MKSKRYNIDDVSYSNVIIAHDDCAFCSNNPIGLLEIQKLFCKRKYWICAKCRKKWVKGELLV